ncbi:hypothetical protein ACOI1C_03805 [Bacillus sp. DJP31]|uniref:hypothetical protein n=1 Tax=Bacillus sp. DJP31 TaxID=3409789 RepID=UPI003BB5A79B
MKKELPKLYRKPSTDSQKKNHDQLIGEFISAFSKGEMIGLINILHEEVVYYSDGGGKTNAAIHPIYGQTRVTKLLSSLSKLLHSMKQEELKISLKNINGSTGIVLEDSRGIWAVLGFEIEQSRILAIYNIVNPDKLNNVNSYL